MSPSLAAHLRLLAKLPVRTVEAKPDLHLFKTAPGKRMRKDALRTHRRVVQLRARGFKQFEIAAKLGVSRATISKHWRNLLKTVRDAHR